MVNCEMLEAIARGMRGVRVEDRPNASRGGIAYPKEVREMVIEMMLRGGIAAVKTPVVNRLRQQKKFPSLQSCKRWRRQHVMMTTVNSAKKTLDPDAEADQLQEMNQAHPKHKESQRRTSLRKKKQGEQLDVPVETVEISGKEANASDTSSIGAENVEEEGEPIGRKSPKGIRVTPVADGSMDWLDMWDEMKERGWVWMNGDGLVDWYIVHPNFAHRSKSHVMREGNEGEDYFPNKESAMRYFYAEKYLGFRGRVATRASTNTDLKDRAFESRGQKRSAGAITGTTERFVKKKNEKKKTNQSHNDPKQVSEHREYKKVTFREMQLTIEKKSNEINLLREELKNLQDDLEIQQETTEQVAVTLDAWQSRFDRVYELAEAAGVDAALLRSIRES